MSKKNRGKQFESKFREDWKKTVSNSFILRLQDAMSGYYTTSQNPCDFICFKDGKLFLVECKSTYENTLNFSKMPQYSRLLKYKNIEGVYPGVLIWFEEYNKVVWVSIKELEKMYRNGNKSVNIKMLDEKLYTIIDIPSIKKKVFMDSDYSILLKL